MTATQSVPVALTSLPLDRRGQAPLYRQLYEGIRLSRYAKVFSQGHGGC
jgi:hypothetical protein